LRKFLALAALAGIGLALAASGHASSAAPQKLSRTAVFLHAVSVAFWIGALLPLALIVRAKERDDAELAKFSRAIPYALLVLAGSGLVLAYLQLDRLDALWTTNYGFVLSAKLAAVLALLGLGAANRYALVPRFQARGARAMRPLARSISTEFGLALAILGVVGLWRFTPPPRALAATEPVSIHFHDTAAMLQIEVEPVRARGAEVSVQVMNGEMKPLSAKEVTLILSNPWKGIEPVRRVALREGDSTSSWRVDDLRIPIAGRWHLRVDILITDFDKVSIEDDVELPRSP
jgi:copper transport protein